MTLTRLQMFEKRRKTEKRIEIKEKNQTGNRFGWCRKSRLGVGSRQGFRLEATFLREIRRFLVGSAKQDERIGFVDAPPLERIHSSFAQKRP
jgi:hypothetical protein